MPTSEIPTVTGLISVTIGKQSPRSSFRISFESEPPAEYRASAAYGSWGDLNNTVPRTKVDVADVSPLVETDKANRASFYKPSAGVTLEGYRSQDEIAQISIELAQLLRNHTINR